MNRACILIIVIGLATCTGCKKEDDNSLNSNETVLVEEAYPNMSGDTLSIMFDGEPITCEFINGEYVYQGDIIIDPNSLKSISGAGLSSSSKRWPGAKVYYTIDDDLPNSKRVIIDSYIGCTSFSLINTNTIFRRYGNNIISSHCRYSI